MPEHYQDAVLAAYKQKLELGILNLNLLNPTVSKLRKACLKKYDTSEEAKDVFSEFFDLDKFSIDFSVILSNADYDGDFRPLLKHIKGETNNTNEKNSELLAWLIDFELRPSTKYYNSFPPIPPTPPSPSGPRPEPIPPVPPVPPKPQVGIRLGFKIIISFLILYIVAGGSWLWKTNTDKTIRQPLPTEQCMYWTGQHYEPIACNENAGNRLMLPLNKEQLNNQQRITMPDTLNASAIDRVWYGKTSGKLNFYTDSGTNPLDTTRRLMPLTSYMLNKYVSYDRYLLNVVIWSVSLFVLFVLLMGVAYKYRPKRTMAKEI